MPRDMRCQGAESGQNGEEIPHLFSGHGAHPSLASAQGFGCLIGASGEVDKILSSSVRNDAGRGLMISALGGCGWVAGCFGHSAQPCANSASAIIDSARFRCVVIGHLSSLGGLLKICLGLG
jgi:hypothetical protein